MQHKNHEWMLVQCVLKHFPSTQAVYLFGSWGTLDEKPDSDMDIALLLPVQDSKAFKSFYTTELHRELELLFCKDIDLINLRQVSTVLQKEVIAVQRRVYCSNEIDADEFEMLTMSFYQKLNEERADILQDFYATKRAVL